jgi:Protein of unknown function (DUF2971)
MPLFPSALENGIDRLFHYQRYNADHLENTIRHRTVRFARASEFNDPWDCKPSFTVPDDDAEVRRLVEFMHSASERHTPEVDPAVRAARAEHYLRNPGELRNDLARGSAEMWAQMDRRYRLYCLTKEPDCPLMWGHYADHHRGVCLEFDVRTRDFCSATQVNYSADYPRYSLDDDTDLSPFYSKSADWAYEEEYRLVAQEESEALGSGTLMTRNGMFQYSSGALLSIIIGLCATAATAEEISEMARAAGIPVRKATRVPDRYALAIDPPIK